MSDFNKNILIISILLVLSIFVGIPRLMFPDLDHGDEFTDASVLSAGENFVRFGFIKCRFLPVFEPNLDTPTGAYTHVPPLSEIFNGLLRLFFKTDSLFFFRTVSILFSFLNILFWYLFVKRFTNSYLLSFLSAIFYVTNPLFIFGIDSLQEPSYSDFLRALILFAFTALLNLAKGRKTVLFFLWILLVLESLVTFEYIIYLSLFFILFPVLFKETKNIISKRTIFILISASVFGFLLHFLQNIWYFGSFASAFEDLKSVAVKRMMQSSDAPPMNFLIWFKYVILRNFSLVFLFDYFTIFLGILFAYFLYQKLSAKNQEQMHLLYRLFLIFVICGISWYIVFPSHSWAHTFVIFLARHLLPAASVAFAIFCYIILCFIKENLRSARAIAYSRLSLVLIMVVIVFTGIKNSELPVTPAKIRRAQEFIKFKECLLKLKEISKEKEEIGVNYFRFPFIRYYTHRHVSSIFDKPSLENLSNPPRYFIFIPYNNQNSQELLGLLSERYAPLFECSSARFPSVFFELRE